MLAVKVVLHSSKFLMSQTIYLQTTGSVYISPEVHPARTAFSRIPQNHNRLPEAVYTIIKRIIYADATNFKLVFNDIEFNQTKIAK